MIRGAAGENFRKDLERFSCFTETRKIKNKKMPTKSRKSYSAVLFLLFFLFLHEGAILAEPNEQEEQKNKEMASP